MFAVDNTTSPLLTKKRFANAYLPRLAEGYVRGEVGFESLCAYFEEVAHLYTIGVDVNAICNLSCGYCYLAKYNRTTAPAYISMDILTASLLKAIEAGVDLIAIVGKEPFADSRGITLLRQLDEYRAAGMSFRYGVVTNGTLLDRYIDQLPPSISYVDISLDGNERTTDSMRGSGVYSRATKSLKMLVDRGYDAWVSAVIYEGAANPMETVRFMSEVSSKTGCRQFYLSPVRNFTGSVSSLLLTFEGIKDLHRRLADLVSREPSIDRVILDHPYESVWRDYFFSLRTGKESSLEHLYFDAFGNILDPLSPSCFRKLDVFPHGPWGTCRIDARGAYLPDVESRTLASPLSTGNIANEELDVLHRRAVAEGTRGWLGRFLSGMEAANISDPLSKALISMTTPDTAQGL